MEALIKIAKVFSTLNINDVLFELYKRSDVQEYIIDLNTEEQLFKKGIDNTGTLLSDIGGNYSPATIEGTSNFKGKKQKGQPFDRITLKDTGDFYETFHVIFNRDYFEIVADTIKEGKDLQDDWGRNIVGLTQESIEKLAVFLVPLIIEKINSYLI